MKYYKLLTKQGYRSICFIMGKIYPEIYREGRGANSIELILKRYPNDWQEVHPSEYFVQEGKMPEYFAIKRVADNPLWEKYIDWLNDTYNTNWGGSFFNFYGYDNYPYYGGTDSKFSLEDFKNNPVELTLEQWDKIINKTMEEKKEIIGWKLKEDCKKNSKAAFYICTGYTNNNGIYGNVESSHDIEKLKDAGVLELWFEPVYKEKTLQFGGYDVTFEKVSSGVRITCNGETGTFSQIEAIYNHFKPNSTYFKFGSQEVKEIIYGQNGSWNLENESDNPTEIKIGCTTGTWEEFTAIYEKVKSML